MSAEERATTSTQFRRVVWFVSLAAGMAELPEAQLSAAIDVGITLGLLDWLLAKKGI